MDWVIFNSTIDESRETRDKHSRTLRLYYMYQIDLLKGRLVNRGVDIGYISEADVIRFANKFLF